MSCKVENVRVALVVDEWADASYLKQDGYEERLAQYQAGDFGYVGVRLSAELCIPSGDSWIVEDICTPGLWGIEDDSGSDYFASVACDEYRTLNEMLVQLGAPTPVSVDFTRCAS